MLSWQRSMVRLVPVMVTVKCLAILYLPITFAGGDADRVRAGELAGGDPGGDGGEQSFGGGQQILALAGALFGQHWVAAADEPLAGEVRGGDLGQARMTYSE